jgi:hypothetical protein
MADIWDRLAAADQNGIFGTSHHANDDRGSETPTDARAAFETPPRCAQQRPEAVLLMP